MNARLHTLLTEAEAQLSPADQDWLAELLEAFMANHSPASYFTPEELAHLQRLDAEPFIPASDEDMKALFARRT